ncbi:hypothetical protein [Sporosalibacterium faouarense]|uniref:hypothetical protein n=1 Tax=Sporosalibacterium faouarense TaxID=516123 RepID=UPI00192B5800|nr:hypothetical protein [Sporosalibacterium faouarense]
MDNEKVGFYGYFMVGLIICLCLAIILLLGSFLYFLFTKVLIETLVFIGVLVVVPLLGFIAFKIPFLRKYLL